MQIKRKLMNQTWENSKNLISGQILAQIDVRHCCKLSLYAIAMTQTYENDKKPNFGPDFGSFGPNLGPRIFFHWFYLY